MLEVVCGKCQMLATTGVMSGCLLKEVCCPDAIGYLVILLIDKVFLLIDFLSEGCQMFTKALECASEVCCFGFFLALIIIISEINCPLWQC